jgi:hypothetical protein
VDPTFTHHAILEDELRLNLFRRSAEAIDRDVATLEVAYAFSNALGVEIFVPYAIERAAGARAGQMLDIEAQPFKWSFVRRYNLILTTAAGVTIPVGPADQDGGRSWRFEPHLFADAALGPMALQGNLVGSLATNGEHELAFRGSLARMFFFGEFNSAGPMLETIWEAPLTGAPVEPQLAPGVKLQLAGWYFGVSYAFPVRAGSPAPAQLAVTGGYHVSFSRR